MELVQKYNILVISGVIVSPGITVCSNIFLWSSIKIDAKGFKILWCVKLKIEYDLLISPALARW